MAEALPGRWLSATEFEFDYPIEVGPGQVMTRIDLAPMIGNLPEGVTPDDVVHAMLHQESSTPVPAVVVVCPTCGKQGELPATQSNVEAIGFELWIELTDRDEPLRVLCPEHKQD